MASIQRRSRDAERPLNRGDAAAATGGTRYNGADAPSTTPVFRLRSAVSKLRELLPAAAEPQLRQAFARHATDAGTLGPTEFASLCSELGTALAPRELECAVALLDSDGTGDIDVDEFVAWYGGTNWQRHLYQRKRDRRVTALGSAPWKRKTSTTPEAENQWVHAPPAAPPGQPTSTNVSDGFSHRAPCEPDGP